MAQRKFWHEGVYCGSVSAFQSSKVLQVQLDCPSDGHWDCAGIFAVEVRFQIWDQFWIPQPKLHGAKYLMFFVKHQNGLVMLVFAKRCFPGFCMHKIGPLSSNHFFSELQVYYKRKFSTQLRIFKKKSKKRCFVLNYCWYTRAWYYRAHADQLGFLN